MTTRRSRKAQANEVNFQVVRDLAQAIYSMKGDSSVKILASGLAPSGCKSSLRNRRKASPAAHLLETASEITTRLPERVSQSEHLLEVTSIV